MPLRRKVLLIISSLFFVMTAMIYAFTRMILVGGYETLEIREMKHSADQFMHSIKNEVEQIKSFAMDWGPWDDTYEFVINLDQDYIEKNLMDETFSNFRLSFIAFMDSIGRFIYGKAFDLEKNASDLFPQSLIQHLQADFRLFHRTNETDIIKGLFLFGEKVAFIASVPILDSKFKGPIRGSLIMGRFLTPEEIHRIREKTQLDIEIRRWNEKDLPSEYQHVKSLLQPNSPLTFHRSGDKVITVYSLLQDIHGQPVLIAGIRKPREIFHQGLKSLHYLMMSLLLVSLLVIVAILIFLEKNVLSRLTYLRKTVRYIATTRLFSLRIHINGRDELSDLGQDINAMLEALRQSEERDKALLENIEDGYFEVDLQGNFTFFNDSVCRMTGFDRSEILGMNFRQFTDTSTVEHLVHKFNQLYQGGRSIQALEGDFFHKNGTRRQMETSVSLVRDVDNNPIGYRGIARDITRRRRMEEELRIQAATDPLTGANNRRRFLELAANEFQRFQRYGDLFCILVIDIDHFKRINDTHGHAAGDEVLRNIVKRFKENLRQTDFFGRMGGEEFCLVLVGAEISIAKTIAERLRRDIERFIIRMEEHLIQFTVSIGLAEIQKPDVSFEAGLKRADAALYKAKRQGRNCIVTA